MEYQAEFITFNPESDEEVSDEDGNVDDTLVKEKPEDTDSSFYDISNEKVMKTDDPGAFNQTMKASEAELWKAAMDD